MKETRKPSAGGWRLGPAVLAALAVLSVPSIARAEGEPATAGNMRGRTPPPSRTAPSPHEGPRRLPAVTDLVISSGGRHLVACYFVPAWNRPGTDWSAWAAHWDLTTGRRTIIPDAAGPLAISPDGAWLVMGRIPQPAPGARRRPREAAPFLWKTGHSEPVCPLVYEPPQEGNADGEDEVAAPTARRAGDAARASRIVAWTFSPDSKALFGVTGGCELVRWDLPGTGRGQKVAGPNADDIGPLTLPSRRRVNLHAWRNQVALLAPVSLPRRPDGAENLKHVRAVSIRWVEYRSGWSRYDLDLIRQGPPSAAGTRHVMSHGQAPYELDLPYHLSNRLIHDHDRRNYAFRYPTHFAFAPKDQLVAFLEPGCAAAVVRRIGGEHLGRFPAAAVHAFTPDGKQLIVSEPDAVLRFWDVATGRIARSLRLDDAPADTVRVAAVQAASQFGQPQANREELARHVRRAARAGARIVVLPETAVTGYADFALKRVWQVGRRALSAGLAGADPKDAAETVPGPSTRFFAQLARRHGIYLSVPLLEVDRKTGRYYNTVVLLGPTGQRLIHYRKLNPWPWAERGWASEGNLGHPVADTPYGRLGVLICYDIHEQARKLAELRVDMLLYSIAWVDDKGSDWFPKRLPDIARRHGLHIVGANWTLPRKSPAPDWHGYGQSTIIDRAGNVLANAQRDIGSEIVLANLPLPEPDRPAQED